MKLLINFISKLGVDTIARLIGFVTLPLITRALGPEGYGQFTYLFIILSYFGFFIDFGYLSYGTNKLCEKVDSKIVIGKIISLQVFTAIISFVVLIVIARFFLDAEKYFLLLIFSLTFLTQIFSIKYYYLANNKLYYNSVSELAGQVIYAALVFLVFLNYPTVLTLISLSVIQTLITACFLFIPYAKNNKIKIDLNIKPNVKTLKEAYKLGLSSKAEAITASFIILCLGFFLNEESVGLYNASYKIYLILLTIVQGLSYSLMPMLLRNAKISERNNVKRIGFIFYVYLLFGLILFAFTFIFSDKIISIMFGEKFMDSVPLLKNFSITILIWPVVMFMSLVLLAYNKYNYILMTSLSSTFFSITLSLLLINTFGVTGAGYVLPLVALGTIIVSYYFLRKISIEENFRITELFSFRNAVEEFKELVKRT
ncbi:MAG: oligosaccharide flippase family protein [Ignavibacteria bacterium]